MKVFKVVIEIEVVSLLGDEVAEDAIKRLAQGLVADGATAASKSTRGLVAVKCGKVDCELLNGGAN